jgi:multiple sugar transport system permease protein
MDPGALQTYIPTLVRYVGVALGLGVIMSVVYRVQIALGVKREAATGRALVIPWVIGFLIFQVFTIGSSLYLSFTDYNLVSQPEWVGLTNYQDLFSLDVGILESREQRSADVLADRHQEVLRVEIGGGGFVFGAKEEDFWRSMRLTLPYAFLSVPIGLFGALAVALLLNQRVRGLSFWRVLYYMPAVLPAVATALLWRWIFAPESGLINSFLRPMYNFLGLEIPSWFSDPNLALPAFIIVSLWGVFGANSVILLAGLKGIPKELYEAAEIDGGGEWAKFRHVTLPMLSPALFYNLVVGAIAAVKEFDRAAFIPTSDTIGTFVNWRIYQEAFEFREMGMASAMAWIVLIVILVLTLLIFRSSAAWVFYQGAREERA